MRGPVEVPVRPAAVVATDNRIFATLQAWGIDLVAAPRQIIASDSVYKNDESVVDLGSHREPDLEALVAVRPDLVLNGQRFREQYDAIAELVPDAALVDTDIDENEPLDSELIRVTTLLGTIFDREDAATRTVADFTESIDRVRAAYDPSQTVLAVIVSGGEINYAAPVTGRTLGPVYSVLGLTPALEAEGSTDHQGDDVSVEAIASANPDWILVMDRDAAVGSQDGSTPAPAAQVLASTSALANVDAVKNGRILAMPATAYLDESIQMYTTYFSQIADAMEAAK
ncbi:siderophore ABC transporter substrate-binding protein [Actinomyces culturomici]|uniref:siderophore ABC transporter substrate-binding protein n=1 Tax=Actinomyces culturomici TaxID=1926276 RepID=UPI0022870EF9|nr:ABC transporter substrate-binding protein [Actinomyces culturomici]